MLNNENRVACVVFDWAGTTVDFGCEAPVGAFMKAFEEAGLPVTEAEARGPMGLPKRDHVRELLKLPRVSALFAEKRGRAWNEKDVDEIYAASVPALMAVLKDYCEPIPGVVETVAELRGMGLKIGSTTGYTKEMMDIVAPGAAARGYAPDALVTPDETGAGRPAPYMIFRNMENVKPGDSNEHVQSILESEVKAMVRNSRNVLATRIDRFGVVSPNIQELESTGRIKLEMPGVKEPERMRKLLQGTANLEFYETYTMQELQQSLMQFAQEMDAANAADTTKASKPVAQLLGWNTGRVGGPIIGCVNVLDTAAVNRLMHSRIAARYLPTNLKACWTVKPIDEKGLYYDLIALKTTQGNPALDGSVITDNV